MSARQELLQLFHDDRPLAHETLFKHRHGDGTPEFHREMQEDWSGPAEYVLDLVFRGGAKSTIAEEAIALAAGFQEFRNCIVVGFSLPKAQERLHAIGHELETNEDFIRVFGRLLPPVWGDTELMLANGLRILAMGRGQSIRGVKFEDARPDLVFIDDLEDRGDVVSPEARKKVWDWLQNDLIPACEPPGRRRIRMAATPLHPEAVPMRLLRDKRWLPHKYPLYYLDEDGEPKSTWPTRWPINLCLEMEESMRASGAMQSFRQEYMCEAEAPESKPFKQEMFRIEPRVKTWQATYSMTDPARTTAKTSATTGWATWSWIGPKLVVWDAGAERLMPDAIVSKLFDIDETYRPIEVGFEEDGLNQWALQAIRAEQVKRGHVIPLRPMKAPNGKIDFIKGLQVYFQAREVEFAKPMPELVVQLLGFPNGAIDAPNALAYAPRMRPGAPIYDDFGVRNVGEDLRPSLGSPVWLCLNATRRVTTGVLAQVLDGSIRVFADYVREGDPAAVIADLISQARLEAGRDIRLIGGPIHFDRYNNVGLQQAIAKIPAELRAGVGPERGRDYVRRLLRLERHGMPALMVSSEATWTLRAFSGGYARALLKQGMLAEFADEGVYRVLMEGIESFAGLLDLGLGEDGERASFNATTPQGRNYRSMIAGNMVVRETKEDWNRLLRGDG